MAGSRGERPEKVNPDVVRSRGRQVGTVRASGPTKAQLAEHEFRMQQERESDGPVEYSRFDKVDRGREPSDARILSQLEYMSDQLSKLQALVRELEERLGPVLIPDFPQGSEVDGPERQASSVVSNVIDDYNGRISELQRRVVQITERIQL